MKVINSILAVRLEEPFEYESIQVEQVEFEWDDALIITFYGFEKNTTFWEARYPDKDNVPEKIRDAADEFVKSVMRLYQPSEVSRAAPPEQTGFEDLLRIQMTLKNKKYDLVRALPSDLPQEALNYAIRGYTKDFANNVVKDLNNIQQGD
jgi:hypothetical protein